MILCVQVEQCAVKMDARPYLVSPFNMKDPPQEEDAEPTPSCTRLI